MDRFLHWDRDKECILFIEQRKFDFALRGRGGARRRPRASQGRGIIRTGRFIFRGGKKKKNTPASDFFFFFIVFFSLSIYICKTKKKKKV